MEIPSEVNDDERNGAEVMLSFASEFLAQPNPVETQTPQDQNDDRMAYSDQESLAEDLDEDYTYEQSDTETPAPVPISYDFDVEMPLFNKLNGETILKLTELYAPLASTASLYEKQEYRERLKLAGQKADYHAHMRARREYKQQLRDLYKKVRMNDLTQVFRQSSASLTDKVSDFYKRSLLKQLRVVERDLNEESSNICLPNFTFHGLPDQLFNPVRIEDFTDKIVWEGPSLAESEPKKQHVVKFNKQEKLLKIPGNIAQKGQKLLYVNYKDQEKEFSKMVTLAPASSLDLPSDFRTPTSSLPFTNRKIEFELAQKQRVLPPKAEVTAKQELQQPQRWGEVKSTQNQVATKFQTVSSKHLFEEFPSNTYALPTNVNPEFKSQSWFQLAFFDTKYSGLSQVHKKYSKVVYNLGETLLQLEVEKAPQQQFPEISEIATESKFPQSEVGEYESKARVSETSSFVNGTNTFLGSLRGYKNFPKGAIISQYTTLKHAQPAYDYPFTKTDWNDSELRDFHRPDLSQWLGLKPVKAKIVRTMLPSVPEVLGENITAHETLKQSKHLSLKEGYFMLSEFIEKRPHLINNFGMSSKLKRYYKGTRLSLDEYPEYVGNLGVTIHLGEDENVPLISELQENQALAVLENNLYKAPVYFHTPKQTDFLLVKYKKKKKNKWYIRKVDNLYTTGQCEPKIEVFAPNARNTNNFQQKRIQAFILKILLEFDNEVYIHEISRKFSSLNESVIRKQMKNINCEQKENSAWRCNNLKTEQEVKEMITPENLCQYESMLAGQRLLNDKGIRITSIDKVPNAIQKLKKEVSDKKISRVASYIEEELTITPWNLTSSYVRSKTENGMMRIEGLGDPTSGHCGFSFVRLPMKIPNFEKPNEKTDPSNYLTPGEGNARADLRTLTVAQLRAKLIKMGYKDDQLENKGRWDLVKVLRRESSQRVAEGYTGAYEQYARGTRKSTKMQKEECQNAINTILQKQIRMLGETRDYASDESSDSDVESHAKAIAEGMKTEKPQKQVLKEPENETLEKQQLEDFKKKKVSFAQPTEKETKRSGPIKVLKRTTKVRNLDGTYTIRVEHITNSEEIENYMKKNYDEKLKSKDKKKVADRIDEKEPFKKRKTDDEKEEKKIIEERKQLEKQRQLGLEYLQKFEKGESAHSTGASNICCGRCGMVGHMKTNRKKCPMYSSEESSRAEKEGMLKTEGNKITFNVNKIKTAIPERKDEKSQMKDAYSKQRTLSARRRKGLLENTYDDIAFQLTRFDHTKLFIAPVKKDQFPDYYEIVKNPVDISVMRAKAKRGEYQTAQQFLEDLELIVHNSILYNGEDNEVTDQAKAIKEQGIRLLREKELLVDIPTSNINS